MNVYETHIGNSVWTPTSTIHLYVLGILQHAPSGGSSELQTSMEASGKVLLVQTSV